MTFSKHLECKQINRIELNKRGIMQHMLFMNYCAEKNMMSIKQIQIFKLFGK